MGKAKAMNIIKEFPAESQPLDFFKRLVFMEKVEKGIKQAEDNKTVTNSKVKEMVKNWLSMPSI